MTTFSELKVVDLKAELKKRGLPQTGLKPALIKRLEAYEKEIAETQEQENAADAAIEESVKLDHAPDATTVVTSTEHDERSPKVDTPKLTDRSPEVEFGLEDKEVALKDEADRTSHADAETATMDENDGPISKAPTIASADTPMDDSPQTLVPSPEHAEVQQEVSDPGPDAAAVSSEVDPSTNLSNRISDALAHQENLPATVDEVADPKVSLSAGTSSIVGDARKRKRRSQSPPPSFETAKKARTDDACVTLPEDLKSVELVDRRSTHDEAEAMDISAPEPSEAELPSETHGEADPLGMTAETGAYAKAQQPPLSPSSPISSKRVAPTTKDGRFKDLFTGSGSLDQEPPRLRSPLHAPGNEEGDDGEETVISPALHAATSALYIRNLMRPLQQASLRDHLISLATPPNSSVNPEILGQFYLDPIRTHCLAVFANVAAASRVRSALHDRVWPNERTRKPLWVDFVPENKVEEWIEVEQSSSGTGPRSVGGKRWEVVYESTEGEEGYYSIQATLREVGSGGKAPERGVQGAPLGPRNSGATTGLRNVGPPVPPSASRRPVNHGFSALDSLFKSTAAKPKLYYLPVTKELADRRLARLADARRSGGSSLSRGRGYHNNEHRRYTFEDGDSIVDGGPDATAGWRGGRRDDYGGRLRGQYRPRPYAGDRQGRW